MEKQLIMNGGILPIEKTYVGAVSTSASSLDSELARGQAPNERFGDLTVVTDVPAMDFIPTNPTVVTDVQKNATDLKPFIKWGGIGVAFIVFILIILKLRK
tara:strand:- start:207 stop:509 length:303 start_codon:yes stop_codon:yes gene_type:complete